MTVSPSPNADLSKMLTVSIDHICTSTAQMLNDEGSGKTSNVMMTIGNWGDYGWFMWVPLDPEAEAIEGLPADLYHIFVYARKVGADYLLIDIDAVVNPDLPVYPEDHDA
jgi:hypothetical protein